jgi:CBS domain containing-hemolysin-like protein
MIPTQLALDVLQIALVVLLLVVNAFFVAAEIAFVSVRRTRVAELAEQGERRAQRLQRIDQHPQRFLAAVQLGVTMASLALGWVAEPALAGLLAPVLSLLPDGLDPSLARSFSAAATFALVTFLTIVVGELTPKAMALAKPEPTALGTARPMLALMGLFRPVIWALNGSASLLTRALGVRPASEAEGAHSVQELKMLVSASADSGVVEDEEEEMLHAVFDFGDTLVRQVMVPRTEVVAVPAAAQTPELLRVALEHPFSKFPVYEGDLDHVIGVLHIRDLLRSRGAEDGSASTARSLMREAIYVPETARVRQLLQRFRARHQHLAIVLDEYGGTAGVVALEDLLEEIVGDVQGPFDKEPEIQPQADGSAWIDGLTSMEEVNERFGMQLEDPHYDTLAGYMLGRLGRMARLGDVVQVSGVRLEVRQMDGLRIAQVRLSRNPGAVNEAGTSA